jgi:hypothetical protein
VIDRARCRSGQERALDESRAVAVISDVPALTARGGAIVGIDPSQEERLTGFSKFLIKGEALRPEDDNFILIGASLIKEYSTFADVDIPGLELLKGVKVGDKVRGKRQHIDRVAPGMAEAMGLFISGVME